MLLTRRDLVRSGAVLTLPVAGLVLDQRPSAAAPRLPRNPFTLGVASGDPRPDGFVIWTRLAIKPLASDGRGGMPRRNYRVRFQVASDPSFRRVVREGKVTATPEWGHSARKVVTGLAPGREYWYRWRIHGYGSGKGRAVTAPATDAMPAQLRVVQMSCSNWAMGYFTAYRHAAAERPDLMVHLGDYIYEYGRHAGQLRPVVGGRCTSLADFRRRYALYRTDPDLRAAHAAAPWLVIPDDHEVENNYAGLDPTLPKTDFAAFRARAYKAWFENQPVRWASEPRGHLVRMHRRVQWGRLAGFHLLDTRQHRSDQVCDPIGDCEEGADPSRTMLGPAQGSWLARGLATSPYRWDLIGQQVFFSRRFVDNGRYHGYLADSWDGYRHSQQELLDMLQPSEAGPGPRNPVILTGDTHAAWHSEVKADWDDPDSATVASEIGCTSISSGHDGYDSDGSHPFMQDNPHLKFHNALRGYSLLTVGPDQLQVDYRVVDRVTSPGSPMWTRASLVVPDRDTVPEMVEDMEPAPTAERVERAPDNPARATLREELGIGLDQ
jgi:alkaline phosphatase D